MLTIADGGGRGVQEPLILADVICEEPLTDEMSVNNHFTIIGIRTISRYHPLQSSKIVKAWHYVSSVCNHLNISDCWFREYESETFASQGDALEYLTFWEEGEEARKETSYAHWIHQKVRIFNTFRILKKEPILAKSLHIPRSLKVY